MPARYSDKIINWPTGHRESAGGAEASLCVVLFLSFFRRSAFARPLTLQSQTSAPLSSKFHMMTAVSPEPDDDEMHLLDADVEAANHEPRHGNAPDAPRISVSRDSLAKPKTPEDVGRPRGVSRYVPTDQAPYSYQDLLSGQRDPNIPGPDKSLTLLTPAPLVHGMAGGGVQSLTLLLSLVDLRGSTEVLTWLLQ
jgi:hypothetical protein